MAKLGDLFPDELLPPDPEPKAASVASPPGRQDADAAIPARPRPQPVPSNLLQPFPQQPQPPHQPHQPQQTRPQQPQQPQQPRPQQARPQPQPLTRPLSRPQGDAPKAGKARVWVKDLVAGQEIEGIYLAGEATLRVARNGSKYIQASFCDKTGSVPARQWDVTDGDYKCYKATGYVKARGRAEIYKNSMQLVVFAVQDVDAGPLDPGDFLPISTRPLEEMEKEFSALLETFTDPDYKRLLQAIFSDPSVRAPFLKGPAAASVHHAWIGGLVEHVLSACNTAQAIAQQRPFLNRDLLLAGVLLHDIGKIEEISAGPGFGYTNTGRLCGHIVLGALLVERFIVKMGDFPAPKRDLLLHLILSHHGTHEFGSPVTPLTAEAVALHHLECLDAKVQGIQSIIERERAAGNSGAWTDFARVVDGRIYMGP